METVYVLTGIPFDGRKTYVLGVYANYDCAKSAMESYNELLYRDLEIEEVEYCH